MKKNTEIEIAGYVSPDGVPYSRQMELINRTGFWYTMSQWYANGYDALHESEAAGTASFDDNILQDDNDEFTLCEVDKEAPGFFDAYLPTSLISFMQDHEKARAQLKIIGAVNKDLRSCGCIVIRVREKAACEVVWMYVSDIIRHAGCGSLLLSAAFKEFKAAGAREVYFLIGNKKNEPDTGSVSRLAERLGCRSRVVTEHFVAVSIEKFLKNFSNVGSCDRCFFLSEIESSMIDSYLKTFPQEDRLRMERLRMSRSRGDGRVDPYYIAFARESCVYIKDGKITGMLLYVEREDNEGIVLVSMKSKDQSSLAQMLSASISKAKESYGAYGYLTFAALNGIGQAMGNYFKIDEGWVKVVCSYLTFKED